MKLLILIFTILITISCKNKTQTKRLIVRNKNAVEIKSEQLNLVKNKIKKNKTNTESISITKKEDSLHHRINIAQNKFEKKILSEYKLSKSEEIYFASKRINETFSEDSTMVEYISRFLKHKNNIKVITRHSIVGNDEIYYLKGDNKTDFFYYPQKYNKDKVRLKSDYYNVKGNCYEFNNEGINHNSIYIEKLCYKTNDKGLSLIEIHLLDGD